MRYFREQGKSDHEVIEALNAKFGDNYQIMSRKTVKLGGIFGVGRRTGVEYFGYILEKSAFVTGNRLNRNKDVSAQVSQHMGGNLSKSESVMGTEPGAWNKGKKGSLKEALPDISEGEAEYYPVSERAQAERDRRSREEILARFAKNKEVQRLLQEKKLVLNASEQEKLPRQDAPLLHSSPHSPGAKPQAVSPQKEGNENGFAPVYDPVGFSAPAEEPEYASVNYDVLSASSAARSPDMLQVQAGFVPGEAGDNMLYDSKNVNTGAPQSNGRSDSWGPQPGPAQYGMRTGSASPGQSQGASPLWPPNYYRGQGAGSRDQGQGHRERFTHSPPASPSGPQSWRGDSAHNSSHSGPGFGERVGYGERPGNYASGRRQAGVNHSIDSNNHYHMEQIEATFLRRLENLERKLDRRGSLVEPNSLVQLRENMYHNEFPPFFVDRLVSQMKRELPLEELEKLEVLWEYVLLHIAENMRFIDVENQGHARIMVLVGPTGVGKTTTIAKLAARQCVEAMGGSKKVHLVTLDNYRIGAQDQIRTYGEILGARVDCVETTEGLATCIAQDQESDIILIDTMGRSPSDHMKLAEMRRFLEYSGNCEIHLAMSSTSGVSAMKEIITQFKPFGFRSVILTKLDELGRIGGTLASFLQEDIPVSYVTTGQKVPQDIRQASALLLFQQLSDVQVNWQSFAQKLEESIL